uniref:ShKT domain-containing protein n=1 Tax=Ditylenchus dipsaci TaxID=166011 RepID=A0A915D7H9_9BILA
MKEEQNKPTKMSKQPIRNIETRLYGAKQLEAAVDGSLQEKSHLEEDTEEVSPPSFKIDSAPANASAVAEEEANKVDKKHFGGSDPQEDGYFGKWAAWTVCREAGERRIRRRKCLDLRRCKGALMQVTIAQRFASARKELKPLPAGAPGKVDDIWSPWLGSCQHFASSQPCKNNEVIGFESRECIAKDPKMCKGPFFRYCTIAC